MKKLPVLFLSLVLINANAINAQTQPLWNLAQNEKEVMVISTLVTAQQVQAYLSSDQGIDNAIDWCKKTGITHVFIESFRGNFQVKRDILVHAKNRFLQAGFAVSGCVTTTRVGKQSTGWNIISCYTDLPTQEHLQKIFEFTAGIFDEIMIDDFLFTDCTCQECRKARGKRSWSDYRCDLMVNMCRRRILAAARKVNPRVKIIIKYPQWYDMFHVRGYDVIRETRDFDRIWVGTETRDFTNPRWGGKVQYEAYFIMRWLGEIGGDKTGGGWFDPYGTTEHTYLEQAIQTTLADAHEMMLFCYGSLLKETGPANVAFFRRELPQLFKLARLVRGKPITGVSAPKPPNSDAYNEAYVYDFVGMLGLPLVPTAKIDTSAAAAFFPVQALKDPQFENKFRKMVQAGTPLLITDGLAKRLDGIDLNKDNITVLELKGSPRNLLKLDRRRLDSIRRKILAPFGLQFDAPAKVALYLVGKDLLAIENFNDEAVSVNFAMVKPFSARLILTIPHEQNAKWQQKGKTLALSHIPPRTLVVFTYH